MTRSQETLSHTPGPWFTADHDDLIVAAGNGFSICDCQPGNPYDVTDAQAVANARLIAAAPELLAVANRVLAASNDRSTLAALLQLREVVAKAEGRS